MKGNLWRAYINTTNPGLDSDYVEFVYHAHDGRPYIALSFPDNSPNVIYVTDWCGRVTSISSNLFQIQLLNDIDNYIRADNQVDSIFYLSESQTIMIGAYIPQISVDDDMTNWSKYLHQTELNEDF